MSIAAIKAKVLAHEFFLGIRTAMSCPDVSVAEYEDIMAAKIQQAFEEVASPVNEGHLLTDAEKNRFLRYLLENIESSRLILRNGGGKFADIANKLRTEIAHFQFVANYLMDAESVTSQGSK